VSFRVRSASRVIRVLPRRFRIVDVGITAKNGGMTEYACEARGRG